MPSASRTRPEAGTLRRHDVDRRRLVEDNLGFVRSIAARYRGYGVPMADLVQEGTIGLIEAAERFDPARGVGFTTYAAWPVRGAILNALDGSGLIRLPRSARGRLRAVRRAEGQLAAEQGRTPAPTAPARLADVRPADAAHLDCVTSVRSLDAPLDGRPGATLLETIAAPEPGRSPIADVDLDRLRRLVSALPPPQQSVLERAFGLDGRPPEDMTRIAMRSGVSPELIRQRKAAALSRLRQGLAA
jgi:RNA polymerase sigma factor (sigma-70 family)